MMESSNLRGKITLGLSLVFIGIMLLFNNSILEKREEVFSEMNLELSELLANNDTDVRQEESVEEQSHVTETALEGYNEFDYILANDTIESLKEKVFKYLEGLE